jgi:hypothetical protein
MNCTPGRIEERARELGLQTRCAEAVANGGGEVEQGSLLWDWDPQPVGPVIGGPIEGLWRRVRDMWERPFTQEEVDAWVTDLGVMVAPRVREREDRTHQPRGRGRKVREYARTQKMFSGSPRDLGRMVLEGRIEELRTPSERLLPPEEAIARVRELWRGNEPLTRNSETCQGPVWGIRPITPMLVRDKMKKNEGRGPGPRGSGGN